MAFQLAPLSWDKQWDEIRDPGRSETWMEYAVQRAGARRRPPGVSATHGVYWGRGNVIDDASGFAGSAALLAAAAALLSLAAAAGSPRSG